MEMAGSLQSMWFHETVVLAVGVDLSNTFFLSFHPYCFQPNPNQPSHKCVNVNSWGQWSRLKIKPLFWSLINKNKISLNRLILQTQVREKIGRHWNQEKWEGGKTWGWVAASTQVCQGESCLGKADAQRTPSALCLWGHVINDSPLIRKRKWPWKDFLRGFRQTQTKALLSCNDWSGKSSEMIIFLPRWVEDINYLITVWPSHLPSLRNDRYTYIPLEDHKYCYSTERRPNKTLIPWYLGRLVRRFMTTIKFKGTKMSGFFISMQKNFAKCIFIVAPAMKKSSVGIAFFPKTNTICDWSATV